MLTLHSFTFNALGENTYLLSDQKGETIIFDPGCYDQEEKDELTNYITENQLIIKKIINTHCHIDHVIGNQFCKTKFGAPLLIPKDELAVLNSVPLYAPMYGFAAYQPATPDILLENNGKISLGSHELEILYVPGHSIGHLAFFSAEQNFVIAGDVLFKRSVGRWDLPGGNEKTLFKSIRETMYALPEKTIVYCGHGDPTTIGEEKKSNPFCRI